MEKRENRGPAPAPRTDKKQGDRKEVEEGQPLPRNYLE